MYDIEHDGWIAWVRVWVFKQVHIPEAAAQKQELRFRDDESNNNINLLNFE